MDELLIRAAQYQAIDIAALSKASLETVRQREEFKRRLEDLLPDDETDYQKVDVILTGSFAREEVTGGSDCDFLITSLDTVGHRVMPLMIRNVRQVIDALNLEDPGSQGVFADFTPGADLIWRIGLDGDSNTNITRRALVLTESVSVLRPAIREELMEKILARYCSDYHPRNRQAQDIPTVPRFLLNDVVRYWRTIAVDFGAKQWRTVRTDMGLRYAKLLTTRKILFAGSLTTLFLTQPNVDKDRVYDSMRTYLQEQFNRSPLARLMSSYDYVSGEGQAALGWILRAYNRFIEILSEPDARELIKADPGQSEDAKAMFIEIEEIGADIQKALETLFFDEERFRGLTRKYGLF